MKKQKIVKDDSERWMLSYLDFITLLMIFFLVMYAISNVDNTKYQKLSSSLKDSFSMGSSGDNIITPNSGDIGIISEDTIQQNSSAMTEEEKLEDIKAKVDELVNNSELKGSVNYLNSRSWSNNKLQQ